RGRARAQPPPQPVTRGADGDERRLLREELRRLLAARLLHDRLARAEGPPGRGDAPLWREPAAPGVGGASLPQDLRGTNLRVEAVVLEELAAAVAPVPALSTHAALPALRAAPDLARSAASGERPWTLVCRGAFEATRGRAGWRLSGRADAVPDLWDESGLAV